MEHGKQQGEMNRAKKITRHTIPAEDFSQFLFLGIVSAEPDYRISVMLNRHLGAGFRKCDNDVTAVTDNGENRFSCFVSDTPAFTLVSNHCEGGILLRKLRKIDFFFVIRGAPDDKSTESLANTIRKIPGVTAVFVFNSRTVNDPNASLLAL
jgi:hypothetical protein